MIKGLDDIAWFQEGPGVRNYQYTTNGTKLINVSNLGGVNLNLSNTSRYISNEEANGKYRHFLCDAGDLVIASSGINEASISEKVSIIKKDDLPLCMNTSVIRFKPLNNDELSVKYLYYFFKSDSYKKQIMKLMTGIAQLNYGPSHLHRIKINYVEKAQQERITSQLDSLSSLVETQKKQLSLLDELIKSRFIEMFGDIDNKPSRWTIAKIQDIAKCVAGATPSTSRHEYWENGTIPWLSSGEVNKYRIYDTNTKITRLGYDSTSTKLIPPHTVVLAMAGQGKTRGTVAMAEIELCTNQSICSLVTNKKMNPDFLLFYLKEQYEQLRAASNGEGGRGGLNLKIIGAFPIMVPPIELQNKFAAFVEQVDKSKFVVQERIKLYLELLNKKMDEYFN